MKSGKANEPRFRLGAEFTGRETEDAKFEAEFEKVVRALRGGGERGARRVKLLFKILWDEGGKHRQWWLRPSPMLAGGAGTDRGIPGA